MREPDALDGARILAIALLAWAALGLAAKGWLPSAAVPALLQLTFFAAPLVYAGAAGLRPFGDAGFRRPSARALLWTLLASLASLWLLKGLYDGQFLLFQALGLEEEARSEVLRSEQAVESVSRRLGLWGLALFVMVPPICEEILFRGIALRGFARGFGWTRATLLTSLLFAALHGTVVQILLMTFLGVYFGTLVRLSGSLWTGILAHAINNGAVLVLRERYGPDAVSIPTPPGMLALAAVVFVGALACLVYERGASGDGAEGGTGGGPSR